MSYERKSSITRCVPGEVGFIVLAGWGLLGSHDLSVPHCRAPLMAHGKAPRPSGSWQAPCSLFIDEQHVKAAEQGRHVKMTPGRALLGGASREGSYTPQKR